MADKTFHSLTLPGVDPARVPDVAAEFNTGTSYAVRDYCTYQGVLYRCTTAHAAGAWNASHFQATNLDNEFDDKLKVPPYQSSAPANPRVGDLWIDDDENSPILAIDSAPIAGSTNAVQSGGTRTLIDGVSVQKANRNLLTGDYSTSATYEVGQLVLYYPDNFSTTHQYIVGESCIRSGKVYKCITAHKGSWNASHFQEQYTTSTDTLYRCITRIGTPEAWTAAHWQATNINTELNRLRESEADTDMIAENFGDSSFYAVGDYVVHNSDLFRCISAVSDTGSWDPDDWIQIKLANEFNELKPLLNNKIDYSFNDISDTNIIINDAADTSIVNLEVTLPVIQNGSGVPNFNNVRSFSDHKIINFLFENDQSLEKIYGINIYASNNAYYGTLRCIDGINWEFVPKYCKASVTEQFFTGATNIVVSQNSIYIQNAFYYDTNGIVYRNRNRRQGGYFCQCNVLNIQALNNTSYHSSQYRTYFDNTNNYTTTQEFLNAIHNFYLAGGVVEFLYEPTDELPTYYFSSEEVKTFLGYNYITNNLNLNMNLTYKTSNVIQINNRVEDLNKINILPLPGNPISFIDSIGNSIINSIQIKILPGQNKDDIPSPINIKNINGWENLILSNNSTIIDSINWTDEFGTIYGGTAEYKGNGIWEIQPTQGIFTVTKSILDGLGSSDYGFSAQWGAWIKNLHYYDNGDRQYHTGNKGYRNVCNACEICVVNNDSINSSNRRTSFYSTSWSTWQEFYNAVVQLEQNNTPLSYVMDLNIPPEKIIFNSNTLTTIVGENNISINVGTISSLNYIATIQQSIDDLNGNINILKQNVNNQIEELISMFEEPRTKVVNSNEDAVNKIYSSRWLNHATAVPLSLLWFTDIHRNTNNLKRIIEFKNYCKNTGLIEDTIVTGDIVRANHTEVPTIYWQQFWPDTPGTDDILMTIGNHEWYASATAPHGKATLDIINDYFFIDVNKWNVVRSSNNSFYYKDYITQGIRLIVTDPAIVNEADENTWLINTLEDARQNNLAVVIASHFLIINNTTETQSVTIYHNNWTNKEYQSIDTITMGYDWAGTTDIVKCVSDFIDAGGNFLCYLIGHYHRDFLCYPTGHPEQLIISLASASDDPNQSKPASHDLPRYANTRTSDCFNIMTFDATNKIVKCIRVGSNINTQQIPRTTFSWDCTTHQFINLI